MALAPADVLAGLAEIIADETGLPVDAVELDKNFTDDLDSDSLSMMTVVTLAEDKFSVRIPDEAVKDLTTVGSAVDFIVAASAE
jgi:acyl carrier protein